MKYGVSLYSYQKAYRAGKLDLEGCLAEIKKLPGGADGVELLPDQTPPCSYPVPTDKEIYDWHQLIAGHGITPVCFDSHIMVKGKSAIGLMGGEDLTIEQQMEKMRNEILLCNRLGFKVMRTPVLYGIDKKVIEDCLPYAEELDVNLSLEIHVPLRIDGPWVDWVVNMIERTGTKHAGLIPDMAIFSRTLPLRQVDNAIKAGADEKLVRDIVSAYENGEDMEKYATGVATDDEGVLGVLRTAIRTVRNEPEDLRKIAKYITNFHAKFYEVDESGVEQGIRYDETMKILKEIGYDGYICSEFEGQRINENVDEIEQVCRQHVMLHKMLD